MVLNVTHDTRLVSVFNGMVLARLRQKVTCHDVTHLVSAGAGIYGQMKVSPTPTASPPVHQSGWL